MKIIKAGTIGWKSALSENRNRLIVKLLITKDGMLPDYEECSYSFLASEKKCRAPEAFVLDIQTLSGKSVDVVAISHHDESFEYSKYTIAKPKEKYSNANVACASGIHFFTSRRRAERY